MFPSTFEGDDGKIKFKFLIKVSNVITIGALYIFILS